MRRPWWCLSALIALNAGYGLPLAFEPNRGQTAAGIAFTAHLREGTLLLGPLSVALRLDDGTVVRIEPVGANPRPQWTAEEPLPGVSNYLRGKDRTRWITRVPQFRRVRCRNLYPGIDLIFDGLEGRLEYDLAVAPGADARAIRLRFQGAQALALDASGNLHIGPRLLQHRPVIYQDIGGRRRRVSGRFLLSGVEVRFAIGDYDHAHPLVIDPVLRYGTYLGGRSRDLAAAVAVDSGGSAYVAGYTVSADFPVTGNAVQVQHGGIPNEGATFIGGGDVFDAFVSKFSPDGSRLIYSTFLGGSGNDLGRAIAVDSAGNAVVAGSTSSPDFPLAKGAVQTAPPSGASATAGFVAQLNADGSGLIYSTYLSGATGMTAVRALALDAGGSVYLAGSTDSASFPATAGALRATLAGGFDGFVTKLNPQGATIVYSTFLGGKNNDALSGLAVDSAGNAYLAGTTSSPDFPSAQGALHGTSDAVIAKLNASGTALLYSTLLGGSGDDSASALALDKDNSALVTGSTLSADFPVTTGAFQQSLALNAVHAFVARLDPSGALGFATLLGGSGSDVGLDIAVTADGSAIVTGTTNSLDFPLTSDAYQRTLTGDNCVTTTTPFPPPAIVVPCNDVFLTIVHVSGRRLVYSTYLGGADEDFAGGMALGADGAIYMAGSTGSNDFPVTRGAYRQSRSARTCSVFNSPTSTTTFACEDAFVLKIDPSAAGPPRPLAAVVNAVNAAGGAVAPGEFVSLYGLSIGPQQADSARLGADGKLVTTLSGTTVTFDGVPAPLLYVGLNQINAIAPFSLEGKSSTVVHIETAAYGADVATLAVAATAPGLISISGTGQGQAAAVNQDGTLNSASNPAARGSVVALYGTGAGQTNPPGEDGRIAAALSLPLASISVTIGGQDARVLYAGAAPGLVEGVIQINVLVPDEVTAGAGVPVLLTAGGAPSQPYLTIAVK